MSLRTRLLALTVCTLAVGMGVLCLAGNLLLAHSIGIDQRQRMAARLTAVTASLSITRDGRLSTHDAVNDAALDTLVWITRPDGRLLEGPPHASPADTALALRLVRLRQPTTVSAPREILLRAQPLRVAGRHVATVVAGVSIAQLEELRRAVLVGSIAVLALTLTGGAVAVRRALTAALHPVSLMTREAEDWSAHDLERRFALGPPRDEITGLAATLDHLLQRIAESRRHEQRFASEVAHELRTPLAAIRGIAELHARTSDRQVAQAALREIEAHSRRIATTLDTLVAVARRAPGAVSEVIDPEALAADFEIELRHAAGRPPVIEGDPAVIRQTLAPLVENARRHALTRVVLEVDTVDGHPTLAVRDDGPGVDAELRDRVFTPGVRGRQASGDGAGLGLPLAQRLADSCGGRITLGDGPGGCFVLHLPPSAGTVASG